MLTSTESEKNARRAQLLQGASDRLAAQLGGPRRQVESRAAVAAPGRHEQPADRQQPGAGRAGRPRKRTGPGETHRTGCGDRRRQQQQSGTRRHLPTLEAVRRAAGDSPIEILHASEIDYKTPPACGPSMYREERTQYAADWETDGAQAAYKRDERLMNEGSPDLVLCLPDGNPKGIAHITKLADEKGVMCHGNGETPPNATDIRISVTQAIADRAQREKHHPSQSQARTDTSGPKPLVAPKVRKPPPEWPRANEMGPAPAGADMSTEPRELTIVVTGTRRPTSEDRIRQALDNVLQRANAPVKLVHGNEPGVEAVAEEWAEENAIESDVYPAIGKRRAAPPAPTATTG